ncbi:MAG TPA: NusG domain II-containing protein [Mobilitalea sp.]|nr:NusG domain II-containing protein [Mobilitalea sp.]
MKKNDFILIGACLIIGIIALFLITLTKKEGGEVQIMVDGKEYKTMSLEEDSTYTLELEDGEWNTFEIKNGRVDMIDASCPDERCVLHRDIHYLNETIVCLPNSVVLQIIGGEENEVDAVAK